MSDSVKKKIEELLISGHIQENLEFILKKIPEINNIIGFDQKHPHHHLDVWGHTLEALNNVECADLEVRMAVLLHDIGKPFSYQDEEVRHFHGHAEVSAEMAKQILKRLNYNEKFIDNVYYLIKMHDTIINPYNLDNSYEMIKKRLQVQYADAKAHAPGKIEKEYNY
ncbi:MAG: HD domain-containing protein [Clostridia bacterium]|nr:HD domain-containing protein [Clostridia bacterium]